MTTMVRFPLHNEYIAYTDLSTTQIDAMAKTAPFVINTEKGKLINPRETDFTQYSVGIVLNDNDGALFFELVPLAKIDINKMTKITDVNRLFTKISI